ncbi:hypothetical protein BaOVIS_011380 [Babesia ovis]|uniref:Uncharacterized protein n=1 Tax=Babesia ovis TaxID=5869 RepID=A0A9W5T936_BABOV|nr:hypothetical protein BaOVIS_011380 [Babesia ovis]
MSDLLLMPKEEKSAPDKPNPDDLVSASLNTFGVTENREFMSTMPSKPANLSCCSFSTKLAAVGPPRLTRGALELHSSNRIPGESITIELNSLGVIPSALLWSEFELLSLSVEF